MSIRPEDRFEILREVRTRFDSVIEAFPPALLPEIIHSYSPDDSTSPGLLSLVALPFWLGERLSIGQEICTNMAVGNLFLLHSFQSFDFIVDNDRPQTSVRSQVVLGSLCYQQVLQKYQPYFSAGSMFWSAMHRYWREWAESILWEEEPCEGIRPFSEEYLLLAAHKAAALKICPTGMALLSGCPDFIPSFEKAVDWMHATMQLLDDLTDWREDLQHHRFNALLSMLVSLGHISIEDKPSEGVIEEILLTTKFLETYSDVVVDNARRGRRQTDFLQIDQWSMMMDGLAETGRWLINQVKTNMNTKWNVRADQFKISKINSPTRDG